MLKKSDEEFRFCWNLRILRIFFEKETFFSCGFVCIYSRNYMQQNATMSRIKWQIYAF